MPWRITIALVVIIVLLAGVEQVQASNANQPVPSLAHAAGGIEVVLQAADADPDIWELRDAVEVLRHRMIQAGHGSLPLSINEAEEIVIRLPDSLSASARDHIIQLLGMQGRLEFRLVAPNGSDPLEPHDLEPVAFTGAIIGDANVDYSDFPGAAGGPLVTFEIRSSARDEFAAFTGSNIGRRLAIVMDGKVLSAPILQGSISSSGQISGMDSVEEAADLALVLRAGSLPLELIVKEIVRSGNSE